MMAKRHLVFLFQEPGMLEAIASDSTRKQAGKSVLSRGYGDSYIPDLLIDYRPGDEQPFAWICYNFDKTYPLVIWGLKLLMPDELFDVPQAGLKAVPLHEAFSWAYTHFVLEDQMPAPSEPDQPPTLTHRVLQYAVLTV
jgi:hypothetical protein